MELSTPHKGKMEAKMEVKMETFRSVFIISKKPIHANRLFSLFAELLQIEIVNFLESHFFIISIKIFEELFVGGNSENSAGFAASAVYRW